jgi:hypothetical protein
MPTHYEGDKTMNGKIKGHAPRLDWQICESEAEWQQVESRQLEVPALPSLGGAAKRRCLRQLLILWVVLSAASLPWTTSISQSVLPAVASAGNVLAVETQYFILRYHPDDAETVGQIAGELDALYLRFYGAFFSGVAAKSKGTLVLGPKATTVEYTRGGLASNTAVTQLAPAEASIRDRLLVLDVIAPLLLNEVAARADLFYAYPRPQDATYPVSQLIEAVRLWQLSQLEGPNALYADHLSLQQLDIFISSPAIAEKHEPVATTPLPDPLMNRALATLVAYAAATYGTEHIPLLLVNYHFYHSWETLIPAVFGVSSADFEVGRQCYLATHNL